MGQLKPRSAAAGLAEAGSGNFMPRDDPETGALRFLHERNPSRSELRESRDEGPRVDHGDN